MVNTLVKQIFADTSKYKDQEVKITGWIRNNRAQKEFGFISLNDGSFFETIQVVYEDKFIENFAAVQKLRVGTALEIIGKVELTEGRKQPFEVKATSVSWAHNADADYPVQAKRHTREFLRTLPHLRSKTNLFYAVFKVRNAVSMAIHNYFQDQGFTYIHTPIITGNDAEGAGEMFKVSTLDFLNMPMTDEGEIDFKQDMFSQKVGLTVSGQIHVEPFAQSHRNVYTFGPTMRAENSNTKIHANEFWMIEPEMAFCDLNGNIEYIEGLIKYIVSHVLENCKEEMQFFNKFVEKGLIDRLEKIINTDFKKVTHKEAVDALLASKEKFEFLPQHGEDLATEHEKYLTSVFGPVFVTDWPKDIKAFYMTMNDDNETVAAVDLLVPGAGELVGGSQREHRPDVLQKRMEDCGVEVEDLQWYLDLRKYSGTMTSGFGIGLERMIMFVTGIDNIRDTQAYPRTPKNCEL